MVASEGWLVFVYRSRLGGNMNFLGRLRETRAQSQVVVYTDGGCNMKKGKVGAYAWKAIFPNWTTMSQSFAMMGTTVNRMELSAIRSALQELPAGAPYLVKSDSAYAVNGLREWLRGWRQNGWLTSSGEEVKNRDLWEALADLTAQHDVRFEHVRGHSGNEHNDAVDKMCTQAMHEVYARHRKGEMVPFDPWEGR